MALIVRLSLIVSTNTDLNTQIQLTMGNDWEDVPAPARGQTSTQKWGIESLVMTHFAVALWQ